MEKQLVYIVVLEDEPIGLVLKSLEEAKASLERAKRYNSHLKNAKIFECQEVI